MHQIGLPYQAGYSPSSRVILSPVNDHIICDLFDRVSSGVVRGGGDRPPPIVFKSLIPCRSWEADPPRMLSPLATCPTKTMTVATPMRVC